MGCDHFPLIDQLAFAAPVKANYCRLTHESYPRHLDYRRDLEHYHATGQFAPREQPAPASSPEASLTEGVTPASPAVQPQAIAPRLRDLPYPAPGSTAEEIAAWSHAKVHGRPISATPHLERIAIVKACDYRGEQLKGADGGCGCNATWHCMAGRGTFRGQPNEVSLSECLLCLDSPIPPPH